MRNTLITKCLNMNLTKMCTGFKCRNSQTLMKEIKDLNKWRSSPWSQIGRQYDQDITYLN